MRRRPARKNNYVHRVARVEAKRVVARAVETKIYDLTSHSNAIDWSTGYVLSVSSAIARGTGETNYIGDKIAPVGIRCAFQYTRADASNMLRLVVIQNKAGGVPLLNTLLQGTANLSAPLSPYDTNYDNTYRVLYDKVVSMDNIRNLTSVHIVKIPGKKLRPIVFNDAAGTIEAGGIYFCWISDSGAAAHPTVDLRMRLYFKDA